MNKAFLIFILSLFSCIILQAQFVKDSDKIGQEKQMNKTLLISKKRNQLQEYMISNEISKAKEVYIELINDIEDKNYKAFNPQEKWLLGIWFEIFQPIVNEAPHFDSLYVSSKGFIEYPQKDDLFLNILDKSLSNIVELEASIRNSKLKKFEKDFVLLWMHHVMASLKNEFFNVEFVENEAEIYLTRYELSPFISFIQKYIIKEFIEGEKGVGYYLSLGYGAYQGNTREYFQDIANIGLGLEFNYQKLYFNTFINLGGSDLKQNVDFESNTWLEGEYSELFNVGLKTGYLFKANVSTLIPYIGAGLSEIMPNNSDIRSNIKYEEFGTGLGKTIIGGITFKYLLAESEYANIIKFRYEKLQWLLNISVEYQQNFYPDDRFNGGLFVLKIGLGSFYDGSYRNM